MADGSEGIGARKLALSKVYADMLAREVGYNREGLTQDLERARAFRDECDLAACDDDMPLLRQRCFVCWRSKEGESFHLCRLCVPYAECEDCFVRKGKDGAPHPHFAEGSAAYDFAHVHVPPGPPNLFPPGDGTHRAILALDGGGIRGYMTCLMLKRYAELLRGYSDTEDLSLDSFLTRVIAAKFSFITGTSIGGIIALLLAAETPLSEITELFETRAKEIFSKNWVWAVGHSTYTNTGVRNICLEMIARYLERQRKSGNDSLQNFKPEDVRLMDLVHPVGVTTYDLKRSDVVFLSSEDEATRHVRVLDAAMATSAAPTYFPSAPFTAPTDAADSARQRTYECIDGGIFANDPSLFALLHRQAEFTVQDHTVFTLGFGTGKAVEGTRDGFLDRQSATGWLLGSPNIIDVCLDASQIMVENLLPRLSSHRVLSTKVNVFLGQDNIALDDINSLPVQKAKVDAMPNHAFARAVDFTFLMGSRL
mmetsp:Transcript_27782/g.77689  ORF Transcript_27782/g.77689 Transcript_27782/m.77689 type:complete len:481 (-) Transcript_27782:141-1583(-)